jgi:uncharacterized repeat protein (TIGR01451 family)
MIEVTVFPRKLVVDHTAEFTVCLTNTGTGPCTNLVFTLDLPPQIVPLQGSGRVEIAQLDAGESATRNLRVRPRAVGTWPLSSTNFSFRDPRGRAHRINDLRLEVEVAPSIPMAPIPDAELAVELTTKELLLKEWETLQGWVINTGPLALLDVAVQAVGLVSSDPRQSWQTVGALQPRQRGQFSMSVHAAESGSKVPLHIQVRYIDAARRSGLHKHTTTIRVRFSGDRTTRADRTREAALSVLFLAADPWGTARLRLGQEFRDLNHQLRLSEQRDRIGLVDKWAVRPEDVTRALLEARPQIVHFSGHGTPDGALCFEDQSGNISRADPLVLARMFEHFRKHVQCVVLNACYSATQAHAIAESIDYVIGMSDALDDRAAIAFAVGFYQALGAGSSFDEAYKLGCIQIGLRGLPGEPTPKLLRRR